MKEKQVVQRKKSTSHYYDDILNTQIRELLVKRSITIKNFASALDVSSETVRQWTSGYSRPDIKRIPQIAEFFNVTIDYLFGKTSSVSLKDDYQIASRNMGLTDNTMNKLVILKNNEKNKALEFINYTFGETNFIEELQEKMFEYFKARNNSLNTKVEINEHFESHEVNFAKFNLSTFIVMYSEKFYENKYKLKKNYLFEMKEGKKK